MGKNLLRKTYWPYDEVSVTRPSSKDVLSAAASTFVFSAPWLSIQLDLPTHLVDKAQAIAEKLSQGLCTPADLEDVSWLFSAVADFPFAYILPRPSEFGEDTHQVLSPAYNLAAPSMALLDILETRPMSGVSLARFGEVSLIPEWTWDFEAALDFSKTAGGFDPQSLFSVSRRFHLLNDLENNKTADMVQYMSSLPKGSPEFLRSTALMLRQNHYITQECERVLSAALPLSQQATDEVREFMQAEKGHDKLLARSLKALGYDAAEVPVLDCTRVLMELFHQAGARNLLAFSMIVDIFERTTYKDEDPFAKILKEGGAESAAEHIETHREINDSGGHENVALGFLQHMKPVSEDYALEALKISELLTQVIHCLSRDTLTQIQTKPLA